MATVRRPTVTLLLLAFLALFFGLGRPAITDSDEGFYAEASREMVETGDWLTPRFNYQDRWQKPVLYYWLTAATFTVSGTSEWGARLWSALAGLGLVLLTRIAATRLYGRDDVGWLAGAIVATAFGCFTMARTALPDLPLAFCITLGVWAAIERRFALAGAAAGLGFLMKGPIALVVPGVILLPIWWREGTWRTIRVADVFAALVPFAVIGLPWYVLMTMEHGSEYVRSFFVGDNLERFATDRFNAPRAWWFYLPIVIGGMMPWSAFLLVLPARPVMDVLSGRRRLEPTEWRLLLWAAAPLLFFTLSIGKQPRYVLPVLVPVAILLARAIMVRVRPAAGEPVDHRGLALASFATAALLALLAVLLFRAGPVLVNALPALTRVSVWALALAALVVGTTAAARRWSAIPTIMPAAAALVALAVRFGALAGVPTEPVENMAELIRAQRLAGEAVGQYHVFVRNLGFYLESPHADLSDEASALEFIASSDRVLLVVSRPALAYLEAASGVPLVRLGEVRYLNTANLRMRTLIEPDPEREIETVLLVANR